MQDIQLDTNGDFRCASCGGRNFSEKRTRRAKVIGVTAGVATVGLAGAAAPLVAKKRLYCQACGVYNRMGNAQPFTPTPRRPPAQRTTAARTSGSNDYSPMQVFVGVLCLFVAVVIGLIAAISGGSVLWSILCGLGALIFGFMAYATGTEAWTKRPKSQPRKPSPAPKSSTTSRERSGTYLEIKKPLKRPGQQNQADD